MPRSLQPECAEPARATLRSTSNSALAPRSARAPRRARSAGSAAVARSASAIAGASPGGTSSPATRRATSSGIPERSLATTGSPLLIASISTTGMPSRLPARGRDARRDEHVGGGAAPRRPAAPVFAPSSVDAAAEAGRRDRALAARRRSGRRRSKRHVTVDAALDQQPAGLDQVGLALDLVQRADADDPQRPRRAVAVAARREAPRVDAGADDVDLLAEAPAALVD